MFWKHLGVFWEHLGVFWGHFGGKLGRHTSAGWPPGGRRMASISLGVLLGSLCFSKRKKKGSKNPICKQSLGNIEQKKYKKRSRGTSNRGGKKVQFKRLMALLKRLQHRSAGD
jgi:hypothetical protein